LGWSSAASSPAYILEKMSLGYIQITRSVLGI